MIQKNLYIKDPKSHLWKLLLIIVSIITFGTLGYLILEDFRLIDAFYMTVITITTVGFGEVQPLDDSGKLFTSALLFISFGFFAYSISFVTSIVLDGRLAMYYRKIRIKNEIKKMKKHTIVIGYGRNGKQAIDELILYREPVVVIDSNPSRESIITENIKCIIGDATLDETLIEAGIGNAKAIVIALPNDSDNLYITISSKILNPKITIISRATSESAERKLLSAGAHHVIMPEKVGGIYMAGYVAQADLTEFLNHLRIDHYNPGILAELDCCIFNADQKTKTVEEVMSQFKTINVLGVKLHDNSFVIAPIRTLIISDVNKIFIMGTKEEIDSLKMNIK